jgi:hypothetical protein
MRGLAQEFVSFEGGMSISILFFLGWRDGWNGRKGWEVFLCLL